MKTFKEEWNKIREHYFSEQHQHLINNSINRLSEKPFVLYGAGAEGVEFAKTLKYCDCLPVCFCDGHKTGIEPKTGIKIISPSDLLGEYKNVNIIISSSMYRESIEADLKKLGIASERVLPKDLLLLLLLLRIKPFFESNSSVYPPEYIKDNCFFNMAYTVDGIINSDNPCFAEKYEYTFDMLADDKSKKVFLDYLKFCLLTTPIHPDSIKSQYFDPVMNYTDNEVFVDCGAYTGDTALLFIDKVSGRYNHYYAFEPDAENRKKAESFLADKERITIIPKGLWNCEKTLFFNSGNASSSAVAEDGDVSVEVTSIDEYFSDKEHVPTTIKMDIEGSELEALKGAVNTIRNNKPKLAICIYHKGEDLYKIPQFIQSCRDDYKFYIRHYTDIYTELVLYAI